ncbi:glycosyl hydrolase family 7 [Colletotrichum asianum]
MDMTSTHLPLKAEFIWEKPPTSEKRSRAELGGHGVAGDAADGGLRHLDLLAVLDEVLGNLVAGELGDNTWERLKLVTPMRYGLKSQPLASQSPAKRSSELFGSRKHTPDVHLSAAAAVRTDTSVGIVGRGDPALDVGLAADELEVASALGVAVSSTVLGTGLVGGVLGHATVLVHLDEVEGT